MYGDHLRGDFHTSNRNDHVSSGLQSVRVQPSVKLCVRVRPSVKFMYISVVDYCVPFLTQKMFRKDERDRHIAVIHFGCNYNPCVCTGRGAVPESQSASPFLCPC